MLDDPKYAFNVLTLQQGNLEAVSSYSCSQLAVSI